MDDANQVPHSGPTIVSHHHTKFSCPGHLARCIYVPLVSESWSSVWRHLVLPHCNLLDTKQVCGKFIAVQWKSPPVRPKPVCLTVPFCQSFITTRHSGWLSTFAEYSRRVQCSTAVCSDCMCYVRRRGNRMAEMCSCCCSKGGGRDRRQ